MEEIDTDRLLDAITAVVPPVLAALETLAYVSRHLHPPNVASLADAASQAVVPVREGMDVFKSVALPDHLAQFAIHLEKVVDEVCLACDGLAQSVEDPNGLMGAYRALRHQTRAVEALYPIALMLPPVGRFFIEEGLRENKALAAKLADVDPARDNVGIIHAGNEKGTRGGFSMYVPEYYQEADACPVIVALHGGSGHGRDFLWTWVREARSRGAILISPTAMGDTWSLMGPDTDSANIDRMVQHVGERWNMDPSKRLLTGMSDGGTFTYVSGLRDESPFTHLAPSSASFHPMLLEGYTSARMSNLPIYIVHGVLDWMFPVDVARAADAALRAAGARVIYREIDDLSHTYPRDENPRIMDWLLAANSPEN